MLEAQTSGNQYEFYVSYLRPLVERFDYYYLVRTVFGEVVATWQERTPGDLRAGRNHSVEIRRGGSLVATGHVRRCSLVITPPDAHNQAVILGMSGLRVRGEAFGIKSVGDGWNPWNVEVEYRSEGCLREQVGVLAFCQNRLRRLCSA